MRAARLGERTQQFKKSPAIREALICRCGVRALPVVTALPAKGPATRRPDLVSHNIAPRNRGVSSSSNSVCTERDARRSGPGQQPQLGVATGQQPAQRIDAWQSMHHVIG